MDNVTICIIVVVVFLFLTMIYIYRDLDEKVESLEKERKEMETRLVDEITDLKRVANKASIASTAATAAATAASLSAKSAKEGFAFAASGGGQHSAPHQYRKGPAHGSALGSALGSAPGAALRASGAPGLPEGFRAAISSAQEKGLTQNYNAVAQEMFDPTKGKTAAATVTPKTRAPMPEGTGMVEAPIPQAPEAATQPPQMFSASASAGSAPAPAPAAIPGINYGAIAQGFVADHDFAVDAYDFSLGDPGAELYLN